MKKLLFFLTFLTAFVSFGQQRSCHTMDNHERLLMEDPHLFERMEKIEQFTNFLLVAVAKQLTIYWPIFCD